MTSGLRLCQEKLAAHRAERGGEHVVPKRAYVEMRDEKDSWKAECHVKRFEFCRKVILPCIQELHAQISGYRQEAERFKQEADYWKMKNDVHSSTMRGLPREYLMPRPTIPVDNEANVLASSQHLLKKIRALVR